MNYRVLSPLNREKCIALDITDPTPWETAAEPYRCPVCRRYIGNDENVMYSDGYGKEVILHESCSATRDLSPADLLELLGLAVSYCGLRELDKDKG